jgi:spoIIIJ-associated protein
MKLEKEELAEEAREFIQKVIESVHLELASEVELSEEKGIRMKLEGPDSGALLADNARLLYAINHLINQIYYRRSAEGCNFEVDCNNYREERAFELRLLARKAAEKARHSGTKVSLQPMPATERRIIHLTLAEEEGVYTQSEGRGRFRRVLISPGQ